MSFGTGGIGLSWDRLEHLAGRTRTKGIYDEASKSLLNDHLCLFYDLVSMAS